MNSSAKTFLTAVVAVAGAAVMALVLADQTAPDAPGGVELAVRPQSSDTTQASRPVPVQPQAAWRASSATPQG